MTQINFQLLIILEIILIIYIILFIYDYGEIARLLCWITLVGSFTHALCKAKKENDKGRIIVSILALGSAIICVILSFIKVILSII